MMLLEVISSVIVATCLVVVFEFDRRYLRIPLLPVGGITLMALLRGLGGADGYWFEHGMGAILGVGLLGGVYGVSRGRWLGTGDIWLAGALGFFFGWFGFVWVLVLGSVGGVCVGALLLLIGQRKRQDPLPLGAFLAAASLLMLLFSQICVWFGLR